MSKSRKIETPPGLSEAAIAVWRKLAPEFTSNPVALAQLLTACRFYDLAEQAARKRKRQTVVKSQRGGPRVHPLIRIEALCRDRFSRIIEKLASGKGIGKRSASVEADPFPDVPLAEDVFRDVPTLEEMYAQMPELKNYPLEEEEAE